MKWLVVLVVAGAAVLGWRWLEGRIQRRFQPRSPPSPGVQATPARPDPPASVPQTPPSTATPEPPDATSSEGFSRGFSAVADDDDSTDAPPAIPEPPVHEDVGSYTIDDWGLQTVRHDAAPAEPEPPAPLSERSPAPRAAPTLEFEDAPNDALYRLTRRLEVGEAPDAAEAEALAEHPVTRAAVYGLLKTARKLSLIPRKHRTQKAMAEADLVVWLADSRLGRPPHAIEQVAVHTLETPKGPMDWYLFRFSSQRRGFVKRGWMAGVSGPWLRPDGPGGASRGDTGSDFEAWGDLSDDEHAACVREHMEAWTGRT
jgi:hypothetical protein